MDRSPSLKFKSDIFAAGTRGTFSHMYMYIWPYLRICVRVWVVWIYSWMREPPWLAYSEELQNIIKISILTIKVSTRHVSCMIRTMAQGFAQTYAWPANKQNRSINQSIYSRSRNEWWLQIDKLLRLISATRLWVTILFTLGEESYLTL